MNASNRLLINSVRSALLLAAASVAGSLASAAGPDSPAPTPAPAKADGAAVKLEPVKFDAMVKQIAAKKAKLTVVDVWATWCGPCKENFPHLVAMNGKYKDKGIAFASVSVDETTKPKQIAEATAFLKEKKAEFPNYVLDESMDDAFEKFDISAIPAVFLFGPDGKVVRRFTLDDPNNQFTYEQVEAAVQEFIAGKPMTTGEAPKKK